MCGICGVFEPDSQRVPEREMIQRMSDTLTHRGPDDADNHLEMGVGLGHRRLSIIDLDTGRQPLCNEDGTIWIVFNGEIYNFTELRSMLAAKGHSFRTQSDTETIVHLYEELGVNCFDRLRGMFAIAIWDRPRRRLVLARDRIGKKPLFYAYDGRHFVFGSELKAVLAAGLILQRVDTTALCDYFCFLYIPAPKSIYATIRKLRPAHYLVVDGQGIREQAYWDLRFAEVQQRSEQEWCEQIRQALSDAVRMRLMSDVPLGSFLSGGIDSSAVVASMSCLLDQPVITCAVGFDEEAYSEVQYARQVAHHVGAEYHEMTVRPRATEVVDRLAWHYDEPFADSSAVPTYYVSKAAREHVTVALSGDGGDESFAGYKRYYYDSADNRLRSLFPARFRKSVLGPLGRWYPQLERAPRAFRAKSTLQNMARDPLEGYLSSITVSPLVRNSLLSPDVMNELRGYDPLEQFREHYRRADTTDLLSRIQYLDIKTYLPDDICVKVDRASMAVSLEVRAPLLDHHLMELAAQIPSRLKLNHGCGKYIFKKAIQDMVPASILGRPKQGFGVPIADWFRADLREWAGATLFENDGILNLPFLQHIWKRHQDRVQDHSALLWAVFVFRQWQKQFQHGTAFSIEALRMPSLEQA
jgi:asparagine synthase (glutamine-hydrolysing)